ncbi:MAG: hypothetical protein U1E05_01765 [Patescibacteria group bacterium]|nr:hypothetical protein [Patescibacteria group bacterium]
MAWNCSNQFRRSGQRDDRRRLLLNEELCRSGASGGARHARSAERNPMSERTWPHYGLEALADQPRVTSLVPRRLPLHFLLLLLGVVAASAIIALAAWAPTESPIAAFDLSQTGSLAGWFLATTLLAASVMSLVVYSVRRYRTDDYRGDYRIWLWAATCWLVLSVDATAGLREAFKDVMTRATGTALYGDGSLWWAVPYLVVLSALGSRLLVDAWPARLSTATLVAAGACLVSAVVVQLGWLSVAHPVLIGRGAEMLGCWLLLVGTGIHARYVVLDAAGMLPRPEPKQADADEDEDDLEEEESATTGEWLAIDAPHQSPTPVLRRREQPKPQPAAALVSVVDTEATINRKLTKQEKKALRQRIQRERKQHEDAERRKWAG